MFKSKQSLKNELSIWQKIIMYLFLFFIFIITVIPMWNVLVMSTSTAASAQEAGLKLWWSSFTFEGYEYMFRIAKFGRPFANSLFVTVTSTSIQVILSSLAGYILIQRELPFKKAITSFILVTMMVPGDLTLVPIYQLNKQLNLLNSYTGLIVNGLVSGFCIMLMRNYFLSVPYSLAESARLDGASEFNIFSKIYMPVSIPGAVTIFFLEFVNKWNAIMIPATITTKPEFFTLPLTIRNLIMSTNSTSGAPPVPDNAFMASIVVSAIPLVLIYIFAQKFLLSGITVGAIKE